MTKHVSQILILLTLLLMLACDPATHYQPKGWTRISQRRWSKAFGQIEVETSDLGGLIGETSLDPEISISNRGKSPAVVESAFLKAGEATYTARLPRYDWGKWEIAPGQTQRLDIAWEFEDDKPIYKVLKDPVEMILKVRVGEERMEILIPMSKLD